MIRMALGECLTIFSVTCFDDLGVDGEQIIPAHSGLAGNSGGDDDDIGTSSILVIVGADNIGIKTLDRSRLAQVKGFALGHAFDDIDNADIPQFLGCCPVGCRGTHETSANNSDLILFQCHVLPPSNSSTRASTGSCSLQLTNNRQHRTLLYALTRLAADLFDHAICRAGERVLHLHGFENHDDITGLYRIAFFHFIANDHARHGGFHLGAACNRSSGCGRRSSCLRPQASEPERQLALGQPERQPVPPG